MFNLFIYLLVKVWLLVTLLSLTVQGRFRLIVDAWHDLTGKTPTDGKTHVLLLSLSTFWCGRIKTAEQQIICRSLFDH